MSEKVKWLVTEQNVTVNYDGQTHIVKRTDALADRLIKALKEDRLAEIPSLVSAAKRIETYSKGKFLVKEGQVFINDIAAPEYLSGKIIRFSNEGLPVGPLVKFAENLQSNPSFRAVTELYQFLEKNNHPLTENGCFIAYKKVRSDFKDVHSGTMDNSVGNVVTMARNSVNEDPTQTCSYGLHAANWDYAHQFYGGGVMLELEINPADVVAIPVDYNQAKMRVCKYKVLSVVTQPHEESVSLRVTNPDYNPRDEEDFDYEEEDEDEEQQVCDYCDSSCGCLADECDSLCGCCPACDESEGEEDEEYPYNDELDEDK